MRKQEYDAKLYMVGITYINKSFCMHVKNVKLYYTSFYIFQTKLRICSHFRLLLCSDLKRICTGISWEIPKLWGVPNS